MSLLLLLGGAPAPRVIVNREFPPDRLAVLVRNPVTGELGGRWAQDESNTENVFSGLTKSGEMPGGHKEMSCALARDPRLSFPDLDIYSDIEVQGPGGEVVWSGELRKKPATDGDRLLIEPAAVGHQAALEDDKGQIGPGFIDSDLSKWGDPSTARRLQLLEAGIQLDASTSVGSSPLNPEDVAAAIINDFSSLNASIEKDDAGEAHYFSEGPDIGAIYYDYRQLSSFAAEELWESNVAVGSDDKFTVNEKGTDHDRATALQQVLTVLSERMRYARVRDRRAHNEFSGRLGDVTAWLPRVVGRHGLPLQGAWPEVGFYAKQMLLYAIPKYTELKATDESIEDDGFLITQAWFALGSMGQLVNELTKYGLLDWFVFQERLFQLRFPGTYGRKWQAYAGPSGLKATGQDGTRLWKEMMVKWRDVDGSTKTAGPPGSGAMFEDASLEVTDPDHPAVKANKTRRDLLELRDVSTPTLAVKTAARFLEEANQLDHSGEATLSGYVQDDKGIWRPVSHVQPGDQVRFPDAADRSYRKVTQPNYSDDSKNCPVTLDAPKEGLIALEERFAAKLRPLGLA
jgi:hypothetical protein